jgi:nitrogen fixation NifU-like protein
MSDLQALYQEVIIDHSRNPRNFCECATANHQANGYNPLCGDKLKLFLNIKDGIIENVCFKGEGCAISTASASLMTEALKGKTIKEAEKLFEGFHHMLTEDDNVEDLGKLKILAGVRTFPMRVKCATLAWHTMKAALKNERSVTTE